MQDKDKKAYKASDTKKELHSLFQPGHQTPRSAATPPALAQDQYPMLGAMPYMNPSLNPMMGGMAPAGMIDPMAMFGNGNGVPRSGGSAVILELCLFYCNKLLLRTG